MKIKKSMLIMSLCFAPLVIGCGVNNGPSIDDETTIPGDNDNNKPTPNPDDNKDPVAPTPTPDPDTPNPDEGESNPDDNQTPSIPSIIEEEISYEEINNHYKNLSNKFKDYRGDFLAKIESNSYQKNYYEKEFIYSSYNDKTKLSYRYEELSCTDKKDEKWYRSFSYRDNNDLVLYNCGNASGYDKNIRIRTENDEAIRYQTIADGFYYDDIKDVYGYWPVIHFSGIGIENPNVKYKKIADEKDTTYVVQYIAKEKQNANSYLDCVEEFKFTEEKILGLFLDFKMYEINESFDLNNLSKVEPSDVLQKSHTLENVYDDSYYPSKETISILTKDLPIKRAPVEGYMIFEGTNAALYYSFQNEDLTLKEAKDKNINYYFDKEKTKKINNVYDFKETGFYKDTIYPEVITKDKNIILLEVVAECELVENKYGSTHYRCSQFEILTSTDDFLMIPYDFSFIEKDYVKKVLYNGKENPSINQVIFDKIGFQEITIVTENGW